MLSQKQREEGREGEREEGRRKERKGRIILKIVSINYIESVLFV